MQNRKFLPMKLGQIACENSNFVLTAHSKRLFCIVIHGIALFAAFVIYDLALGFAIRGEKCIYRVIQKSQCTWWLQYRKLPVMLKVSPASLQTLTAIAADRQSQRDTRLTLTPSVSPISWLRYHGKWLKLFKIFLRVFCAVIVRCTETFWSSVADARPHCLTRM
jgi:UDP-2,3-diacylglucosamine pyrophosphatase LpxH